MRISVVIPTYRRVKDLCRCLQAVRQQTRPSDEVVVIVRDEDAATQAFLDTLEFGALPLRVMTVCLPGQVAALNAGLEVASGEVVAITDDDACPRPDWLARIEAHFCADAHVGGVGGRDWVHHAGWGVEEGDCPGVGKVLWFGRTFGNHHLGTGDPRDVDFFKGANMSFRRAAIDGIRFDLRLRGAGAQTHNDMAFCLRVKRAGWRLVYDPAVAVDHYESPRWDEDQRGRFHWEAHRNILHNETLTILEHLAPAGRMVFVLGAVLYGSRSAPGLFQALRLAVSRAPHTRGRWSATLSGRFAGVKAFLTSRGR